jgi:hypothetical protein
MELGLSSRGQQRATYNTFPKAVEAVYESRTAREGMNEDFNIVAFRALRRMQHA